MKFYAIRGAITVAENNKDEILKQTRRLLSEIMHRNHLEMDDIISIIFTATRDLDAVYPAVAARELGLTSIPLTCCQEMHVAGSLEKCIRVLFHIQLQDERILKPVYLDKAVRLRPDLAGVTIAIDGPAGAGKSTVAKILAEKLGILYLDTGAMYRAMGLKVLEAGGNPRDPKDVLPMLPDTEIDVKYVAGVQRIYLDGREVTNDIRTQKISTAASEIGTIPEVRQKLVELQQQIAEENSLVMDGRDIGTHVMPNASLKIFLTASSEERARRRWEELKAKGVETDYNKVLQDIIHRDNNDSNREYAPLRKADDAILIDCTNKNIDQVVSEIESLIRA
jgi:cytidylate kinase